MIGIYSGIVLLLILDQLVKYWTVTQLTLHSGVSIIDGVFSLFYLRNEGAAWGILSGNMLFFYIVTISVVGVLAFWVHTKPTRLFEKLAYMFVVAGALGNFIDRVRLNYVIDMFKFDFINFPVFNVADICLTIGIVIFLIDTIYCEWVLKGKKYGKN